MRKLILQVQMTLDGFVAGPNREMDWMWLKGPVEDDTILKDVIDLAIHCDTILMGRGMIPEFIEHWETVVDRLPESPEIDLAHRMVDMRKIVFSRTVKSFPGRNLEVENGDLEQTVKRLKNEPGKDIVVYGGATFNSALIDLNLVDEYWFYRNPVAIGQGLSIFKDRKILKLESSKVYKNGKQLNKYLPV